MGLKGKIEAIIYAAEEPITLEQLAFLMKEPVLQELAVERESAATDALDRAAEETAEREQNPEQSATEAVPELLAELTAEPTPEEAAAEVPTQESPAVEEAAADEAAVGAESLTVADVNASETPNSETPREEPAEASEKAKAAVSAKRKKYDVPAEVKVRVRALIQELVEDYANNDRGMDIRQVAGGYRMATKPEHHDIVKAFAKSLKPPLRLSLPALETLAVVAYKQPVTAPEVGEIRGVDSQGVMATLLERKLVTTAGRKAVIGRPILYKTTKEFLMRFGMNDVSELPSMEEFEKLAQKEFFNAEEEAEGLSPAAATDTEAGGDALDVQSDSAAEVLEYGEPEGEQAEVTNSEETNSEETNSENNQREAVADAVEEHSVQDESAE